MLNVEYTYSSWLREGGGFRYIYGWILWNDLRDIFYTNEGLEIVFDPEIHDNWWQWWGYINAAKQWHPNVRSIEEFKAHYKRPTPVLSFQIWPNPPDFDKPIRSWNPESLPNQTRPFVERQYPYKDDSRPNQSNQTKPSQGMPSCPVPHAMHR